MSVATIPLYGRDGSIRAWTLVSEEDADDLRVLRWHLTHYGYAASKLGRACVYMHRAVLDLATGDRRQTDHINGNRLDNRRENLRAVTQAENLQNRIASTSGKTSAYRGVSFNRRIGKWIAQARHGDLYFYRAFDTEIEAAHAASKWRAVHMPCTNEARHIRLSAGEAVVSSPRDDNGVNLPCAEPAPIPSFPSSGQLTLA